MTRGCHWRKIRPIDIATVVVSIYFNEEELEVEVS